MNYIRHLTGFFDRVAKNQHLNATHVSLYMAIFQLWNVNRFKNPISLFRNDLMDLSKVGSKTTYHKCLKELDDYGYLRYTPSYHPLRGSWVFLFEFKTKAPELLSSNWPGSGEVVYKKQAADGQLPYNLNLRSVVGTAFQAPLNIYKHIKLYKLSFYTAAQNEIQMKKERKNLRDDDDSHARQKKKTGPELLLTPDKVATSPRKAAPLPNPGIVEQAVEFFRSNGYPEREAAKFFYYYHSTGWRVGGKSPIENWHSAAHGWMLNINNSDHYGKLRQEQQQGGFQSGTGKDYSEPL